jgi:hypothetical protein
MKKKKATKAQLISAEAVMPLVKLEEIIKATYPEGKWLASGGIIPNNPKE